MKDMNSMEMEMEKSTHKMGDLNDENLGHSNRESKIKFPFIPMRFVIIALSSLSTFIIMFLRMNLSIAIVVMVNHNESASHNNTGDSDLSLDDRCHANNQMDNDDEKINGELNWNGQIQGIILGAYFLGYTIFLIIGGRISERWGSKWTIFAGICASIICTLLTPIAAESGIAYIIIVRVIMGMINAPVIPSIYTLYTKWIPKTGRATALGAKVTLMIMGIAIAPIITAQLCNINSGTGWRFAFYIPGCVSIFWIFLWVIFVTDTPEDNKFISQKELKFIQNNIEIKQKNVKTVPWKSIFTNMGVWAVIVSQIGSAISSSVLLQKLPAYLHTVLMVDIQKNGLISTLMSVGQIFSSPLGGPLSEYIQRKQIISLTVIRKIFQTIAILGVFICLLFIPIAGCNDIAVSVLLILSMTLSGFDTGGGVPILTDMTPSYSGTVYGIATTFISVINVIMPYIVGVITGENESRKSWDTMFYVLAGVTAFGLIFFNIFATAEVQPWGVAKDTRKNDETKCNDNDHSDHFKNKI